MATRRARWAFWVTRPRLSSSCNASGPAMLFNSLAFAIFLPLVLAGYYLLRGSHKGQNRLLLAASLFFYACWDWRFLSLLFITMIVDFYVAAHLEDLHERGAPDGRRKRVLAISMFCNLAMLGFFKYCNFFIDS